MSTVTLHTGEAVDSDSPEWRAECLARHQHVQAVLAMRGASNRGRRAAYVESLEATNGVEFVIASATPTCAWPSATSRSTSSL